jgi:hypothetical protein
MSRNGEKSQLQVELAMETAQERESTTGDTQKLRCERKRMQANNYIGRREDGRQLPHVLGWLRGEIDSRPTERLRKRRRE